ncbi:MAG: hypothetical protein K2I71_00195, partial [Helicobacter sp.]|nr:hypothetical protein [Helicobacter sp.]
MINFITFVLFLYFCLFLCYWVISAILRKIKSVSLPRSKKFKIAKYLFFASFIAFFVLLDIDNRKKQESVAAQENLEQQVEKKPVVKREKKERGERPKEEKIISNESYDIEPMKLDFIAGKIEYRDMMLFVFEDSGDFLYNNGVESIDGLEFRECVYLNIFSKDFRKDGKTDLAPIREHCYKELKDGNPYKKAYRSLDPFNEYSILGKVVKNNSSDFRIIRSGMKKDKQGYVKMLVVWEGTY